ncbi:MAG: hypothetical protein WD270_14050 [Acetobacterales bacterium]
MLRDLLLAAPLLALAACGGAPREPGPTAGGPAFSIRQAEEPFNRPSPGDLAVIGPESRAAASHAPVPSPAPRMAAAPGGAPRAQLPPVNADPRQFIGLSAGEVIGRLGQPTFRRVDRPATVWQYRGGRCIVDVFLYREGDSDRVIEVLVRTRPGIQSVSSESCVGGLLRPRETPQPG